MVTRYILLIVTLYSVYGCSEYPLYKSYSKGRVEKSNYNLLDSVEVILLDVSAVHTKSSQMKKVIDTLEVDSISFSFEILDSISRKVDYNAGFDCNYPNFKLPYKRSIPKYLGSLEIEGNKLIIVPAYTYNVSTIREGGGGVGFSYSTGYKRLNITKFLYVAIFDNSQLVFVDNAVRFEGLKMKEGENIEHEFPSDVADELLNRALKNYVERLKK